MIPSRHPRRRSWSPWSVALVLIAAVLLAVLPPLPPAPPVEAAGLPGLQVRGNQLVDATGRVVVLHGVDRAGSEYACIQNAGIFDGPNVMNDDAQVPLMKSWGVNEALIGLNEDCWLGINGVSAAYGGANYISAIQHEVTTLESYGIYPIIPLFWEAPGTSQATDQIAMPDNDHAPLLWQQVATTFKNDPRVIFRLKEEPYPAGNTDGAAAWQCWKMGDVQYDTANTLIPVSRTASCSEGYQTVGMQSLINIIRGTGATNVIAVPGVEYANSMTHFLDPAYRLSDPLPTPQLMGVVDVYPVGNVCGDPSCYASQYAPVAAQMPFMAGEFGESVDGNTCTTSHVDALMSWLDAHQAGYSAWDWDTWGGCLQLITDYSTGKPNGAWGTDYQTHLLSLAQTAPPPSTTTIAVEGSDQSLYVNHGSGYAGLGGGLIAAPAAVSLPGGGHLYIVTGVDHYLWERTDTLPWQPLAAIPTYCIDNPAAVLTGSTLIVSCTGGDYGIYVASISIPTSGLPVITGWTPYGGASSFGPAVMAVNGTPTIFAVGVDNRLYWRTASQTWTPFSNIWCTGHPAAATSGSTSYVACHGGDNALWYASTTGSGWSGFQSLGGGLIDGPAIAGTSAGPVFVAEGSDTAAYQRTLNAGWWCVGGVVLHGVAVTAG